MNKLRILIACEESQRVCTEFRKLGHEAYSCDIQEQSGGHPEWHIQSDVTKLLKPNDIGFTEFRTNEALYGRHPSGKVRCWEKMQVGGKDRGKNRSKTFTGIAKAMAKQWSEYLIGEKT